MEVLFGEIEMLLHWMRRRKSGKCVPTKQEEIPNENYVEKEKIESNQINRWFILMNHMPNEIAWRIWQLLLAHGNIVWNRNDASPDAFQREKFRANLLFALLFLSLRSRTVIDVFVDCELKISRTLSWHLYLSLSSQQSKPIAYGFCNTNQINATLEFDWAIDFGAFTAIARVTPMIRNQSGAERASERGERRFANNCVSVCICLAIKMSSTQPINFVDLFHPDANSH